MIHSTFLSLGSPFAGREITFEAALADLSAPRWEARAFAASALATCEEEDREEACSALRRAALDPISDVRFSALASLGALLDKDALPLFLAAMEDGDSRVREAAVIGLGRLGDKEAAFPPLKEALFQGPPEVRFQATGALAELDGERAAPLLIRALGDGDPEVRQGAAAALFVVPRSDSAAEALAALLSDPAPGTRFEAAKTLSLWRDPRCLSTLLPFLQDRERAYDAAEALGRVPDPKATPALRAVLGRWLVAPLVKVQAAYALERSVAGAGMPYLRELARSRKDDVRGLAAQLIEALATGRDPRDLPLPE